MEYTLQIKYFSTHWAMRVLNADGECVRVHTGLRKNLSHFAACKEKIHRIYENIRVTS